MSVSGTASKMEEILIAMTETVTVPGGMDPETGDPLPDTEEEKTVIEHVFHGELLKKAEDLLDMDIHATIIAMGYRQAAEKLKKY